MKILISDYEDELKRDLAYEEKILKRLGSDVEIKVYPYENKEALIRELVDVDVLLTAFLNIDEEVISRAPKLKCISVNATGYGTIDIKAAAQRKIGVCRVKEYCTEEVAEHALALMLALTRNLKHYTSEVDHQQKWLYQSVSEMRRLKGQTLGIFGFGRIGRAVAQRAQAFGMKILAVDPYVTEEMASKMGVTLVDKETALRESEIITNHMNQSSENSSYFNKEAFEMMEKRPIFINVGRGEAVDEEALVAALDEKRILAAGLDVLKSENPKLGECALINRENVILTPHAAFYSDTSMKELQRISCENIVYYMQGQLDKVLDIVG